MSVLNPHRFCGRVFLLVEKKKVTKKTAKTPAVPKKTAVNKLPKPTPKARVHKAAAAAIEALIPEPPKKKKKTVARRPPGRPTEYSEDVAVNILVEVAMGKSMRTIVKMKGMPAMSTIFLWLKNHKDFSEQYARAKEESADAMAEDILYIADHPMPGEIVTTKEDEDGKRTEIKREDMLGHRRLMVDTRKFLMVKLKPKKYGDKLALDAKSKIEGSVTHKFVEKSDDELRAIAAAYAAEKKKEAENAAN